MFWNKKKDLAQEYTHLKLNFKFLIVFEDGLEEDEIMQVLFRNKGMNAITRFLTENHALPKIGTIISDREYTLEDKIYGKATGGYFEIKEIGKPNGWETSLNKMVKIKWIKEILDHDGYLEKGLDEDLKKEKKLEENKPTPLQTKSIKTSKNIHQENIKIKNFDISLSIEGIPNKVLTPYEIWGIKSSLDSYCTRFRALPNVDEILGIKIEGTNKISGLFLIKKRYFFQIVDKEGITLTDGFEPDEIFMEIKVIPNENIENYQKNILVGNYNILLTVKGIRKASIADIVMNTVKVHLDNYYSTFGSIPNVGEIIGTKNTDTNKVSSAILVKEKSLMGIFKRGDLYDIPSEIALTVQYSI